MPYVSRLLKKPRGGPKGTLCLKKGRGGNPLQWPIRMFSAFIFQ